MKKLYALLAVLFAVSCTTNLYASVPDSYQQWNFSVGKMLSRSPGAIADTIYMRIGLKLYCTLIEDATGKWIFLDQTDTTHKRITFFPVSEDDNTLVSSDTVQLQYFGPADTNKIADLLMETDTLRRYFFDADVTLSQMLDRLHLNNSVWEKPLVFIDCFFVRGLASGPDIQYDAYDPHPEDKIKKRFVYKSPVLIYSCTFDYDINFSNSEFKDVLIFKSMFDDEHFFKIKNSLFDSACCLYFLNYSADAPRRGELAISASLFNDAFILTNQLKQVHIDGCNFRDILTFNKSTSVSAYRNLLNAPLGYDPFWRTSHSYLYYRWFLHTKFDGYVDEVLKDTLEDFMSATRIDTDFNIAISKTNIASLDLANTTLKDCSFTDVIV
ncbi:MAG TPA: hypothetical protein VG603_07055, partial [Chitinophagales bacterium]|nr:hypothetical protein [Chitinophagales bacterium]